MQCDKVVTDISSIGVIASIMQYVKVQVEKSTYLPTSHNAYTFHVSNLQIYNAYKWMNVTGSDSLTAMEAYRSNQGINGLFGPIKCRFVLVNQSTMNQANLQWTKQDRPLMQISEDRRVGQLYLSVPRGTYLFRGADLTRG